jgi:hypothetical protein
VRWPVRNDGAEPVRIVGAVHPHSQFRGPNVPLDRVIAPGEGTDLALPVRFDEAPGAILENPFLIMTIVQGAERWRVLARVQVRAGPRSEPIAGPRVVATTNRVGAA